MNPVNATALYVSASRLVLNYDPGDPQSFTEINKLLPYFRQSLSCCVCGEDLSFVPCTMSLPSPPPRGSPHGAAGRPWAAPPRRAAFAPAPAAEGKAAVGLSPPPRPREPGWATEAARETFLSLWPRSPRGASGRRGGAAVEPTCGGGGRAGGAGNGGGSFASWERWSENSSSP